MTDDDILATNFRAISHPRRARIFRLLAQRPELGRSFEALKAATGLCDSSLVHHLREMERCGLVRRRRKGPRVAYLLSTGGLAGAMARAEALGRTAQPAVRPIAQGRR